MRNLLFISLFMFGGILQFNVQAQCENWNGAKNQEEAETAHSIYQGALESEDYGIAFEYWEKAYGIAPAADGRRASHYRDGIEIYKHKLEQADSEEDKKEYIDWILKLYKQAASCYQSQSITLDDCNGEQSCYDEEAGYYLGRRGYDMFYSFNSTPAEVCSSLIESIALSGNKAEYIVFRPLVKSLVKEFQAGNIAIEDTRSIHKTMTDILDYNIEHSEYAEYYKSAQSSVERDIRKIEGELYDCDYFIEKYVPEYEANPEDGETIESVYRKLKSRDCPEDLPIMQELEVKYAKYVEEYNRAQMEELAKTNPGIAASLAYEDGRYSDAVEHYTEAIAQTEDDEKKADYYFNMASIQGRRLNQYSRARDNARKAAQYKSNWGKPYMLIGDLYASTSRNCGDSWQQRLAILAAIDKYTQAKNVDPSEASNANQRIATYNSSKPRKEQAHMRGLKPGDKAKVDCWIGEVVTIRF